MARSDFRESVLQFFSLKSSRCLATCSIWGGCAVYYTVWANTAPQSETVLSKHHAGLLGLSAWVYPVTYREKQIYCKYRANRMFFYACLLVLWPPLTPRATLPVLENTFLMSKHHHAHFARGGILQIPKKWCHQ